MAALLLGAAVSAQEPVDTTAADTVLARDSTPRVTPQQVMDWIDRSKDTLVPAPAPAPRKDSLFPNVRIEGFAELAMGFGSPDPDENEDSPLRRINRLFTMAADFEGRAGANLGLRKGVNFTLGLGFSRGDERAALFPEVGQSSSWLLSLERAFLEYSPYPFLGFEAGIIGVPFTRYNLCFDERESPWLMRGDFFTYLVPTPWHDAGLMLKGRAGPKGVFSAEWRIALINGLSDSISGGRGLEKAPGKPGIDRNRSNALAASASLSYPPLLRLTLSGTTGDADAFDRHPLDIWSAEISFVLRGFSLDLGILEARLDTMVNSAGDTLPLEMGGLFAEVRECFSLKKAGAFILAAGIEDADLDRTHYARDMIGFPSRRTVFTLGLAWNPGPGLSFKAQFRSPRNKADGLNPGNINDDLLLLGVTLGLGPAAIRGRP